MGRYAFSTIPASAGKSYLFLCVILNCPSTLLVAFSFVLFSHSGRQLWSVIQSSSQLSSHFNYFQQFCASFMNCLRHIARLLTPNFCANLPQAVVVSEADPRWPKTLTFETAVDAIGWTGGARTTMCGKYGVHNSFRYVIVFHAMTGSLCSTSSLRLLPSGL